jgi:hypothetical protein
MNLFSKFFNVVRGDKVESFELSPPDRQHPETARRSKRSDFPSKSMRRGVQQARERAQRPFRLAAIANSVQQALDVRAEFRKKQLVKREIRAELRKAA